MAQENGTCPCGSGNGYADCCGRFHAGQAAPTAELLMRSRYAAYALVNVPYLLSTTHSSLSPHIDPLEVRNFAQGVDWKRLVVLDAKVGAEDDEEGFVEFQAWYKHAGGLSCLWERSRFLREDGKWKYHSGEHQSKTPKIGRNDPCPCESGKKYKKCCA